MNDRDTKIITDNINHIWCLNRFYIMLYDQSNDSKLVM